MDVIYRDFNKTFDKGLMVDWPRRLIYMGPSVCWIQNWLGQRTHGGSDAGMFLLLEVCDQWCSAKISVRKELQMPV